MERNLHANQVAGVWGWLQSIDYGYNAQGWLTAINNWNPTATVNTPAQCAPAMPNPASPARTFYNDANDLMYMDIRYDQLLGISGTSGTIQKAGNISQIAWRARGRETQIYSYGYDYLSRLTTSTYYNYSDAAVVSGTNNYNENLSYDLRGNIQTLQRTGFYTNASTCTYGEIDNLTYSYTANTNRLHKVLDATLTAGDAKSRGFNGLLSTVDNSMTYDANGNLTKNLHKNVSSISYNHLNLPTVITFTSGNTIEFLYDAGGSKLRKTVKVAGVVQYVQDYLGGIEYRQTGIGVKRIESIFHAEGRYYNTNVDISNTVAWRKEYNFKDHLGNTRLVFTDRNGNGVVDITGTASTSDVLQENHYYAFGLAFEGAWLQNDPSIRDNKYQYNGKELNDDFGLNWNDYGARWYDAAIGRWNGVDAMANKYDCISPYVYVSNNPISLIDPNGLEIELGNIYEKDKKTGEYKNPQVVKAFEAFAKSEGGRKILAQFAKKDQVIAGYKYSQDGQFHKSNIDLKFDAKNLNNEAPWSDYGPNGRTNETSVKGRNVVSITINSALNSYNNDFARSFKSNPNDPNAEAMFVFDRSRSIVHELLVHGENSAIDFYDNGKIDSKKTPKQEHLDARATNSRYSTSGFSVISQITNIMGLKMSEAQIRKTMYQFVD